MKQFEVITIEKDSGKLAGMYPDSVGRVAFKTRHEAECFLMNHRMKQYRIGPGGHRQYAYIARNGY